MNCGPHRTRPVPCHPLMPALHGTPRQLPRRALPTDPPPLLHPCSARPHELKPRRCRDEFRDACVLRGAVDTTAATVVLGSAVDIPLPPIDPDEQP